MTCHIANFWRKSKKNQAYLILSTILQGTPSFPLVQKHKPWGNVTHILLQGIIKVKELSYINSQLWKHDSGQQANLRNGECAIGKSSAVSSHLLGWLEKGWQVSTGRWREAAGMRVGGAGRGRPEPVGLFPVK